MQLFTAFVLHSVLGNVTVASSIPLGSALSLAHRHHPVPIAGAGSDPWAGGGEDRGAADRALAATPGSLAVSWWWSLESPEDTASPKLCAAPAFNPSLWLAGALPSAFDAALFSALRSTVCFW